MKSMTDTYTLSDGVEIPCLGFGTWQIDDGKPTVDAVCTAVEIGYRHIDTAAVYENEKGVGEGIRRCGIDREKLFVTSKLWNTERGRKKALAAFERTMGDLKLDYLDLYLVHWPASPKQFADWERINRETWEALEELYRAKRIRAIGVSNFLPRHLESLLETAEVVPVVDQIEFHPGYMQAETLKFCRERNILVEAWSPLGRGRVLDDAGLKRIAKRYGKSAAQVCLRWCLRHGTLPLPKSTTPARIKENANLFDFDLSPEDMAVIDALPELGASGLHPDEVDF